MSIAEHPPAPQPSVLFDFSSSRALLLLPPLGGLLPPCLHNSDSQSTSEPMSSARQSLGPITTTEFRVRYAESDQMGVAHHSHYVVWCEQARTEYMRSRGISYREIERTGILLPVVAVSLRYKAPAAYEDLVRVRCWVRAASRRHVEFGYVVERADDSAVLATARTTLMPIDADRARSKIPDHVLEKLVPVADPVRL